MRRTAARGSSAASSFSSSFEIRSAESPATGSFSDAQAATAIAGAAIVAGLVIGALLPPGIVALLGGFRARTDLRTAVEPGSLIVTGPFEVTVCSVDDVWQRLAAEHVDALVVQGG